MWRGGCIIRSRFLGDIKQAYDRNPELTNLMLDSFFTEALKKAQDGWRRTIALAGQAWHRHHHFLQRAFLLRFLPLLALARQLDPGPARLLSAPTPTSAPTSRAASSSIPTGPARAAPCLVDHLQRLSNARRTWRPPCPSSASIPPSITRSGTHAEPRAAYRRGHLRRHRRSDPSQDHPGVLSPGQEWPACRKISPSSVSRAGRRATTNFAPGPRRSASGSSPTPSRSTWKCGRSFRQHIYYFQGELDDAAASYKKLAEKLKAIPESRQDRQQLSLLPRDLAQLFRPCRARTWKAAGLASQARWLASPADRREALRRGLKSARELNATLQNALR